MSINSSCYPSERLCVLRLAAAAAPNANSLRSAMPFLSNWFAKHSERQREPSSAQACIPARPRDLAGRRNDAGGGDPRYRLRSARPARRRTPRESRARARCERGGGRGVIPDQQPRRCVQSGPGGPTGVAALLGNRRQPARIRPHRARPRAARRRRPVLFAATRVVIERLDIP